MIIYFVNCRFTYCTFLQFVYDKKTLRITFFKNLFVVNLVGMPELTSQ